MRKVLIGVGVLVVVAVGAALFVILPSQSDKRGPGLQQLAEQKPRGVEYFLKLAGIEGESTAQGHEKEINVDSFAWGTSYAVPAPGTSSKASPKSFSLKFNTSKASPKLLQALLTNMKISTAVLTAQKVVSDKPVDYLKFNFTDVLISSYDIGGGGQEQISLNFTKIQFEYRPFKPDGTLDAPVTTSWDFASSSS